MSQLSTYLACAAFAAIAGASTAARAGDAYGGSVADAYKCEAEIAAQDAAPDQWKWLDETLKANKLSPACKAVFESRIPACLKDPYMQSGLKNPEIQKGIPNRACHQQVWGGIWEQVTNDRQNKKQAEEEAKAKADRDAKAAAEVAARELPKAKRHDANLEKLVANAYRKDYPDGKILKVLVFDWSDDYEKDAFDRVTGRDLDATVVNKQPDGRCFMHNEYWLQYGNGRSFSGPLSARGAGSASDKEILCSKAEAGASVASAGKAKKKSK